MGINKIEYGNFSCIKCGKKGLRFKDNPCSKCKKTNPNSPQTKPTIPDGTNSRSVVDVDKTADNPFDNLIKELENEREKKLFGSGNDSYLEKQIEILKAKLQTAKQCKKIHEEEAISLHDFYNQEIREKEEEIKQKVQKLKEFVNPKEDIINELCCPTCMWKKLLFDELDKIFGGQDD